MLQAIARLAIARPRRIIAAALLIMAGAAIFGLPVVKELPAGGFRDPTSESWHASRVLSDTFGHGDMQLVISVKSDAGAYRGHRARRVAAHLPVRHRREVSLDGATAGGIGIGQ